MKNQYQTEKYDKHVSAKRLIKLVPNIEQVTFEEKGGEKLYVIPCINDRPDWINVCSTDG